jgi:hypothetical protein
MSRQIVFGVLLIAMWYPGIAATQSYRVSMPVPPVTLYETMLDCAERQQFEQVYRSLPFLKQIFEKEKVRFGVDLEVTIRKALASNDRDKTLFAIQRVIFFDIKDIFAEIEAGKQESAATLKTWFIMANMDYKLLSPRLRRRDSKVDQNILAGFYEGGSLLRSHASPSTSLDDDKPVDFRSLKKVMRGIEKNMLAVFPEFKKESGDLSLE